MARLVEVDNSMSGKKYFVLMEGGNDTAQVFVSKQPRGAALKAATRGHTAIELRERGTNNCLLYTSPSPRDKRQSRMPSSA